MKDGEGINQRTFMQNPRTTMWGLAWGGKKVCWVREGKSRKVGTTITA